MKYYVVEIFEDGSERLSQYLNFYEARDYASGCNTALVVDITDYDGNVLESWSKCEVAGEYYIPPREKRKWCIAYNANIAHIETFECGKVVDLKAKKCENHIFFNMKERWVFEQEYYLDTVMGNNKRLLAEVKECRVRYTPHELWLIKKYSKNCMFHI